MASVYLVDARTEIGPYAYKILGMWHLSVCINRVFSLYLPYIMLQMPLALGAVRCCDDQAPHT